MTIPVNTRIVLDVHKPKKDAVVAQPGLPPTANEVAIWAAAAIDPDFTQSIVGTFNVLLRVAQAKLSTVAATGPTVFHVDLGASEAAVVVDGTPTAEQCRLEVGSNIVAKQQSHFLDRTFKRLIERWLEESKSGTGDPVIVVVGDPGIDWVNTNQFRVRGFWQPGTKVLLYVGITDVDGDRDTETLTVTIPEGAPPEGWDPVVVANVLATEFDRLPHVRVDAANGLLQVDPVPDYTLEFTDPPFVIS